MALLRDSIQEQLGQWHDTAEGPFVGGLNTDVDAELIEDNQFAAANNAMVAYGELQSDTGTTLVGQVTLRGDPRRVIDYVNPLTNGSLRFCVTNTSVYKYASGPNQWQYVSNGTETTLTVAAVATNTALTVASIAGFANADFVGVMLDTGAMHFATVNGAPAGNIITITPAMPSGAAIGKQVVKAVALTGSGSSHVTPVVIPWSGQVVFTNTIENVKILTPATGVNGACIDMTGTGLPANMKCNTLALYDNSLILAGNVEAGTIFSSRFRYCAKGDLTLWNTLEAGSTDLLENFGQINQALPLGPYLIFYRRRGISRVSIGGAGRFTPDGAVPLAGAVASNLAAVDLVDKHIVLGTKGLFWYRGGFAIEPIDAPVEKSIWSKTGIIKTLSAAPAGMFLVPLTYRNEVLIAYGTGTSTGIMERYNLEYNVWTRRQFDSSGGRCSGFGEAIESSGASLGTTFLCDSVDDKVVLYDQSAATDDGDTIFFSVDTKDFSHKSLKTKMDFLEVKASGSGTLTVSYSVDGGTTPVTLGTCALTATPTRFRMYKNLTVDKIRFRFSNTVATAIHFFNLRHQFTEEF